MPAYFSSAEGTGYCYCLTCSKFFQVSTGVYEKLICDVSSGKVVVDTSVISRIVWSSWTR